MAPAPPQFSPSPSCARAWAHTHTHTLGCTLAHTHTWMHTRVRKAPTKLPFCRPACGVGSCQPAWEGWGRRKRWGSPLINYLRHSGVGLPSAICLRYGRELEKGGGGESAREEEKRKEETLERNRKANGIQEERLFTLKELAWGGGGKKRR